ncbi:MAG: methyltransferase domain-containing protein, partial [Opitutaceae bacterium]
YRTFWGEHIHHGFWREGSETPVEAQVNLTRELAGRAALARGDQVLDIGCGLGGSALLLAEDFGCFVKGISISPKQITAAKEEAGRRGLQHRAAFAVEDANDLPAGESNFDVVWTIECSEHLFDKRQFISTCAKSLKPGGRLAICAWLAGESLNAERRALVEDVCRGMLCPSLGTMADYVTWMKDSGLEILSADDITANVARTWDLCRPVLNFPLVKTMLAVGSPKLHAFANSFTSIAEAYRTGAMAYGMIVGRKPALAPAEDDGLQTGKPASPV